MNILKKFILYLLIIISLNLNSCYAESNQLTLNKYPDYAYEYLGNDRFEKFNRKMFNFNSKLNKYALKPMHILWASIMPQYGMDRIKYMTNNIEYPIRLMSSLIQRDFKTSGKETVRFLTNTTIGLGGMFDPAKHIFKFEQSPDRMEQALASTKLKSGPFLVVPGFMATCPRDLCGKALNTALNPTSYIATPILAAVKAGLLLNRTAYMQPLMKMIESTYADPYDITKKLYGIESHIKNSNMDNKEVLDTNIDIFDEQIENIDGIENVKLEDTENTELSSAASKKFKDDEITIAEIVNAGDEINDIILKSYNYPHSKLMADMLLEEYNPQDPVTDSMRTALFELPDINNSIWNEMSLWNRSFSKRIKTSSVNITPNRDDYRFRYILQKQDSSPLAIIFPSIGEGINSTHSTLMAKLFFDAGYSVIIEGSAFHWEFAKSMPENYRPGNPSNDADYLKTVTAKIISKLENKKDIKFNQEKVVIGTSFGALTALFLADKEYNNNTLGITKYISICPPVELVYAMNAIDKNTSEWNNDADNLKDKVALTASKIIQIAKIKEDTEPDMEKLPFTQAEAKLITGFIMHQKLSDLIYTIEKDNYPDKKELYKMINSMNYRDYVDKYILSQNGTTLDELNFITSLHSISDYLQESNNYKIYHSINDYLTNPRQLKQLKLYTGNKSVYLDNGAHLGFLYREEFIDELKKDIALIIKDTEQQETELSENKEAINNEKHVMVSISK